MILAQMISRPLMAMSLSVPLMLFIYLNVFAFPEYLFMLMALIVVTNFNCEAPKTILSVSCPSQSIF